MEKVNSGENTTIEYETCGAGEPIILIHGSVIPDSFMPLVKEHALTSRYRLVRYHHRGYMGTTHSAPPVRIIDQAHDCLGLMHQFRISGAHIVGPLLRWGHCHDGRARKTGLGPYTFARRTGFG
jgi:pimeloyl-ACP methyl ester carboxylesterase